MEGVDYAFSNPRPTGLFTAGKRFAMRYVGPGTSPKHLTVAEAGALKAAGLSLVTLVEGATGDPRGGFAVGVSHARSAVAMLKARGFPTDRPMYFAIDYDLSATAWPAAREYLRGAGSIIGAGLVGIYGEYDAMVWATRDKAASWFFQTYAWSGGRWHEGNHVEQYRNGVTLAGGTVDLCRSRRADFGQWGQPNEEIDQGRDKDDMDRRVFLVKNQDNGRIYRVSNVAGTAQYMAPELVVPGGPVSNVQVHQEGLLEHLYQVKPGTPGWSPDGRMFLSGGDMSAWGLVVGEPGSATDPGGLVPHTHAIAAAETGQAEEV